MGRMKKTLLAAVAVLSVASVAVPVAVATVLTIDIGLAGLGFSRRRKSN
jgi:hypothetical protein